MQPKDKMTERALELIKERGISKKEFAEKLGVSQSTITEWSGGRQSALQHIMAIAKYFGVSLDYLCGLTDDPSNKKEPSDYAKGSKNQQLVADIVHKLEQLPEDKLAALTDFIDKFTKGE